MTARRRFFPLQPAQQQVPGQTLELGTRLVPIGAPPVDPGTGPDPNPGPAGRPYVSWLYQPDGDSMMAIGFGESYYHEDWRAISSWEHVPVRPTDPEIFPWPSATLRCTDLVVSASEDTFFGAASGAANVRWELSWSAGGGTYEDEDGVLWSESESGQVARAWGAIIAVDTHVIYGGTSDTKDTLTAIAYNGAIELGRIVLEVSDMPR